MLLQPLLSGSYIANSWAEDDELFYENPTFPNLERQLSLLIESSVESPTIQKYSLIFLVVALDKHKAFVSEFVNKYASYPKPVQQIVAQAVAEVGGPSAVAQLKDDKVIVQANSILKFVEELNFVSKDPENYNEEDMKYNCIVADSLILAFHASGDSKYLARVMKYLADWPEPLKLLAWEMLNRESLVLVKNESKKGKQEKKEVINYQDIIDAVEKTQLANRYQLFTYKIILWAIESNKDQHKDAGDKIEQIKQNNPELDYSKNLKL